MVEEEQEIEEEAKKEEKRKGISIFRIAGLTLLFVLFVGGAFAVSHYRKLASDLNENININRGPVVEMETEMEVSPTEGAEDEESLIMRAVLDSIGLEEEEVDFSITDNTGIHAKGNVREVDAVGGGYWLAANTEDGWVHVYDGQAHPTCEQIEPFDFPLDLVEECLDSEGEVVARE
jgi:hypothetical protein